MVKALQSTLSICAFVVFFSVVLELLSAYGVLAALAQVLAMFGVGEEWARRLVAGLLELSSGVSSLTGRAPRACPWRPSCWAGPASAYTARCCPSSGTVGCLYAPIWQASCATVSSPPPSPPPSHGFSPWSEPVSSYLAEQAETIAGLDFTSALAISLATVFVVWTLWVLLCGMMVKKTVEKCRAIGYNGSILVIFANGRKRSMLFEKDIEPRCAYCKRGSLLGEDQVICLKRGIMSACRLLSRLPVRPPQAGPPQASASGLFEAAG